MTKTMLWAPIALAAIAAAHPAEATTVYSNSFETPTVSGISYAPTGDTATVTFAGGAGLASNGDPFGYQISDGNQAAHLQNGGSVTIDLSSFLTAGQTYSLDLTTAQRPGYDVLPITVTFDGVTIGSFSPTSTTFTSIAPLSFAAISGGSDLLAFVGGNGASDLNAAIDSISVSAAPEAGTWMMMILGFGMVGGVMRSAYRTSEKKFTAKVRSLAAS